jgi:hypothetical protein
VSVRSTDPQPTPPPDRDDGGSDGPLLGGLLEGRASIAAWTLTSILGVLLFAWTLRRQEDEDHSPLAAALALVGSVGLDARPRRNSSEDSVAPVVATIAGGDTRDGRQPESLDPTARMIGNRANGWQSRPALRFTDKPARGVLRRRITYRLVRLSDGPDDLHSREIMRLDRGDEIEIVADEGNVLQVRTPTGEVGWIPGVSILG